MSVDWAQSLRAEREERLRRHPVRRRIALALLALWGVSLALGAVLAVWHGHWFSLVRLAAYAVLLGAPTWRASRGPRRAIELNTGPAPS